MNRFDPLRELEKGWDGYFSDPPTDETVDNAEYINHYLEDNFEIFADRIVPSVEGGVVLTYKIKNGIIDVEILNDPDSPYTALASYINMAARRKPEIWEISMQYPAIGGRYLKKIIEENDR